MTAMVQMSGDNELSRDILTDHYTTTSGHKTQPHVTVQDPIS